MTDELKNFFKEQGLTQKDLAEILGVSQPYIGMLLTGKKSFGKNTANIWSEKFGLSASWLLTGEGEMLKQESGQTVETVEAPRVPDDSQPCLAPLVDEMAAQRVMFQSELAAQRDLFKSTVDQLLALSQRLADTVNRLSEE